MNREQRTENGRLEGCYTWLRDTCSPATVHPSLQRGVTVVLVLVFMGIFLLILGGLSGYIFVESKAQRVTYVRESAFQVAEAGLEYYRWFLAHNPGNLTDGTGVSGPYIHTVADPEGGALGSYALSIVGNTACNVLQSIDITSVGSLFVEPGTTRTLSARYAKPSVAEYAYIINNSVWAGADRDITGPYHSNGGIRMDGTNNSTVTSSVPDWLCTSSFGCSPTETKPGVFGSGSGASFWVYPVPQKDFAGFATDFPTLKTLAQADGLYFASQGGDDQRGYHLIFKSNGTVDVYQVTRTSSAESIHIDNPYDWSMDYDTITRESWQGNYTIPSDCSVIFVNDKAWIEGTVGRKVTLVAQDSSVSFAPDIILQGNIDYTAYDGSVGLTAIAENSVRIPKVVPYNLSVRGIFVAQSGYFGRDLYICSESPYDKRGTLTITGSIVSNYRVGTKWSYIYSSCGSTWSGFNTRVNAYDQTLAQDPPPFTPVAGPDSEFVVWEED